MVRAFAGDSTMTRFLAIESAAAVARVDLRYDGMEPDGLVF